MTNDKVKMLHLKTAYQKSDLGEMEIIARSCLAGCRGGTDQQSSPGLSLKKKIVCLLRDMWPDDYKGSCDQLWLEDDNKGKHCKGRLAQLGQTSQCNKFTVCNIQYTVYTQIMPGAASPLARPILRKAQEKNLQYLQERSICRYRIERTY